MISRAERSGLRFTADLPEPCPVLPAAVEVAVYRIATEAVTNVVRHAAAGSCTVRLRIRSDVHLQVSDDGSGYSASSVGVGTTSMRERAEELGGSCTITVNEGGGCVVDARLPAPPRR